MIRTALLASATALFVSGAAMAAEPVPEQPPLGTDIVTYQQLYGNGQDSAPLLAPIGVVPKAMMGEGPSEDVYGGLRPEPNEVMNKSNAYKGS